MGKAPLFDVPVSGSPSQYQMADKKEDKKDEKGADGKGEGKGDGKGEKAAWAERSRTLAKTGGADRGNLTRPENRATGSVDKKVYSAYFLSWGPLVRGWGRGVGCRGRGAVRSGGGVGGVQRGGRGEGVKMRGLDDETGTHGWRQ